MATVRWTGGGNDGVWTNTSNWSGSSVPVSGDDVYIDVTNQNFVSFPTAVPASGTGLSSLTITPGFTGDFAGGSVTPPRITADILKVAMGGSAVYIGAGTRNTTHIDSTGRGKCYITDGTNTTVNLGPSVNVEIGASATAATINQSGGTLTILYNSTAVTTLNASGIVTCYRPITTCVVNGGATLVAADATTSTFVTTATVNAGARWNHRAKGNIGTLNLLPRGAFDAKGAQFDFTVGSTAFNHWVGSIFDRTGTSITITVSNENPIGARSVA